MLNMRQFLISGFRFRSFLHYLDEIPKFCQGITIDSTTFIHSIYMLILKPGLSDCIGAILVSLHNTTFVVCKLSTILFVGFIDYSVP